MTETFNILLVGDIDGSPGRDALFKWLPSLISEFQIDFIIVNGENAAGGFGITPEIVEGFFQKGVDVITTGNHIWRKKEVFRIIDSEKRLLRPVNMPAGAPGFGYGLYEKKGYKVGVVNALGRVYMDPLECPFRAAKEVGRKLKADGALMLILDFHAEATSEKMAMGHYLDGLFSCVVGTHTHVQTSDARVLSGGTGYITDAGMTGPHDSVIGVSKEKALRKFVTGMPAKFTVAEGGVALNGAVCRIDPVTGHAHSIESIIRASSNGSL